MNCNRCGGVMTYEKFYGSHEHFGGWRCIFCGEIVDEVILENRLRFGECRWLKARGRDVREVEKDDAH